MVSKREQEGGNDDVKGGRNGMGWDGICNVIEMWMCAKYGKRGREEKGEGKRGLPSTACMTLYIREDVEHSGM